MLSMDYKKIPVGKVHVCLRAPSVWVSTFGLDFSHGFMYMYIEKLTVIQRASTSFPASAILAVISRVGFCYLVSNKR